MATRHVVWDWNGTLLDDAAFAVDIMNGMLARRGLPPIDEPFYRAVIEFPVEIYYRKLGFDFSRESFECVSDEFVAGYQAGWRNCPLQPKALETIDRLKAEGRLGQSVLSASKAAHLSEQVEHFGVAERMDAIAGVEDHHGRGKLHMAAAHVAALGVPAGEVVFIGDTLHDAEVARQAGAKCILVGFGHYSRPRLETAGLPIAESMDDLLTRLLG